MQGLNAIRETPLQFGEGGRLFAILTEPSYVSGNADARPVFVFLNSGLVQRIGPCRLYYRLARALAENGISSLRVDLSGIGDSPARSGLTLRDSVEADFADIRSVVRDRLGPASIVLVGLCSGADNAIRLVDRDPSVTGLVLLDPVCDRDKGFEARALKSYLRECSKNPTLPLKIFSRRLRSFLKGRRPIDPLSYRALPTTAETKRAFGLIAQRDGRTLSIFTRYALSYYNEPGQLQRSLEIPAASAVCDEILWRDVEHTYTLEMHRERVIKAVVDWAVRWVEATADATQHNICQTS
jgi:pimeloyl-ACP methyl ester carboxylesterase